MKYLSLLPSFLEEESSDEALAPKSMTLESIGSIYGSIGFFRSGSMHVLPGQLIYWTEGDTC